MRRITLLFAVLILIAALPVAAQPQQQESLGDVARQIRNQKDKDKDARKATKVFTNDNLPAPKPGEAISSSPATPANPAKPDETTSKPATPPPSEETGSKKPESGDDKLHDKDYWQGKFKAARQDLANAKSRQQLGEDELNLLQIQQAREIDPSAKADLTTKVQNKQSEVDVNKATTDAAQKTLDDLEQEFKDSGAPADWSQAN
jgi:hypothetical protein